MKPLIPVPTSQVALKSAMERSLMDLDRLTQTLQTPASSLITSWASRLENSGIVKNASSGIMIEPWL